MLIRRADVTGTATPTSKRPRSGEFFWSTISRVDTETGKTESYDFGERVYWSEALFFPPPGFPDSPVVPEEPGWLLTEIYSDQTNKSPLAIPRADQVADGPVANAHLHHHAPFSLHGSWEG